MAKKAAKKAAKSATRKGSAKRERMSPRGDARLVRRDTKGRITESDDVGRAQRSDRRTKASTRVKPGYGDRGDQKTSARKGAKKR